MQQVQSMAGLKISRLTHWLVTPPPIPNFSLTPLLTKVNLWLTFRRTPDEQEAMNFTNSPRLSLKPHSLRTGSRALLAKSMRQARRPSSESAAQRQGRGGLQGFGACLMIAAFLVMALFG